MNDYARRHLARWQVYSVEDWQGVLRQQGYGEGRIAGATILAERYIGMGYNMREAREKALELGEWHSSGQF